MSERPYHVMLVAIWISVVLLYIKWVSDTDHVLGNAEVFLVKMGQL